MQIKLFWIECACNRRLAVLPRPRGGDWLKDEIASLRACRVDVLVSLLTLDEVTELDLDHEASFCDAAGMQFLSFPINDRGVPERSADYIGLVQKLADLVSSANAVAIHCRQGIGRSGMVAASVLVSLGDGPDAALLRVAGARGCAVPDTAEQRAWVLRFAESRRKATKGLTLLLSTRELPAGPALVDAARNAGWSVQALDEPPVRLARSRAVYYGGSDVAMEAAARFQLALLEPPLDLLARLPAPLLLREVQFVRFRELTRLKRSAFVKPADPVDKCFDGGIYADAREIRTRKGVDPETPVLVAEPVEWLAEYRCFVRDGKVAATSPYLSFGRPVWQPWGRGGERATPSKDALAVCQRLLDRRSPAVPPAFVVDVGLIEGRGWAVVEFNPAWCSGLLGADPAAVLSVLELACRDAEGVDAACTPYIVARGRRLPQWP